MSAAPALLEHEVAQWRALVAATEVWLDTRTAKAAEHLARLADRARTLPFPPPRSDARGRALVRFLSLARAAATLADPAELSACAKFAADCVMPDENPQWWLDE